MNFADHLQWKWGKWWEDLLRNTWRQDHGLGLATCGCCTSEWCDWYRVWQSFWGSQTGSYSPSQQPWYVKHSSKYQEGGLGWSAFYWGTKLITFVELSTWPCMYVRSISVCFQLLSMLSKRVEQWAKILQVESSSNCLPKSRVGVM